MFTMDEMEKRLIDLIQSSNSDTRAKWALEWKKKGQKVVGWLDPYVPEELIYAAGMLPYRVVGTGRGSLSKALAYRPVNSDAYYTRVLESQLLGELDFIDLIVTSNGDEDQRRLYDVLARLRPTIIMFLPRTNSEPSFHEWERSLTTLAKNLENISGEKITEQSLNDAIVACNKKRTLMQKLYELRKREIPPLSGTEFHGIICAAMSMPVDFFNSEIENLIPFLENRKTPMNIIKPRLLLSSDALDNPGYVQLIEEAGSLIAMDDMNIGSRYLLTTVDITEGNLLKALVKRDVSKPANSQMTSWPEQINQIIEWVKEYKIDGVVELKQVYNYPREFRSPMLKSELEKADIPFITISREYNLANVGQLQTRIGAFIEILTGY